MLKDLLSSFTIVPEVEDAIEAIARKKGEYDPWGLSYDAAKTYFSLGYWIYRYFRPKIVGIENIPDGRVVLVPNHSGQFPFDGLVIALSCLLDHNPPRLIRTMAERWFPTLPFVNIAFSRSGVAVGDPINGKNLLEAENALLVFPEGARGSGKTWDKRYQLQDFGRGFMRLALQTHSPIVPIAVIGAEESIVSVHNAKGIAELLGMPYFPVPALLPLLGPLSYLPLPTQFTIYFGKPILLDGPFDDEDHRIAEKVARVEKEVDALIKHGLAERESVFGGASV